MKNKSWYYWPFCEENPPDAATMYSPHKWQITKYCVKKLDHCLLNNDNDSNDINYDNYNDYI